jgi:hypothetical protein
MISIHEAIYHMVKEDLRTSQAPDYREDEKYFEVALVYLRDNGLEGLSLSGIELDALVGAARRRGRLEELDRAVGGIRGIKEAVGQ